MFFVQAKRSSVVLSHPELSVPDVAKLLGAQWRALTPVDKIPYEEKAEADKARYKRERANFEPTV